MKWKKIHHSFNLLSNLLVFSPNQCTLGFYYMTGRPAAPDVSSRSYFSSYKDLSWTHLLGDEQTQTFQSAFTRISSDPLIIHICFNTVIYPVENALIHSITCLIKPIDLYIGLHFISSSLTHLGLHFGCFFLLFWGIHGTSLPVCQYPESKQLIQTCKRYTFSLRDGGKMMMHLVKLNVLLLISPSVSTSRGLLLSLWEN